ncbi:hypothetical protein LOZ57_006644 [Ophidiomyces ophidiicola]|uniref:uncharacterized protein n=1 Tax=Ophidiomyces ophidiicola TaxID=1387563 RepID=UPI0020C2663F|nr:uncharacterized protein LOZ57_006644 [Ophidiomyces ophidiicola]KAI1937070.1 hypothetical protein LOZ57_006644 [Ophidiomyces ophidiicola]KAI2047196.1 hypothetical protein LOZ43_005693 [Ophidiomyces ophidiicola]
MASTNVISPAPSTTTPTRHHFERKVEEVKPSKTDINYLVMNYLVTNGYPLAARKFALEANIPPQVDVGSIQERVEIRNAIYSGNIKIAIEKMNELNPLILDCNPSLHFSLLQLQLIELIRECTSTPNGDISPALDFATAQLAPRAPTNPQFLEDLEKTLSLLIFPAENLSPALAPLLDPALRKSVAARVNEAILQNQGANHQARLRNLVKLRRWAEKKARLLKKDIPSTLDIGLDHDRIPKTNQEVSRDNNTVNNGDTGDDVVMQESTDVDIII